ncbi:MAG: hypothetical protein WBM69_22735 [Desulfobacterales bacterium]
MKKLLRFVFATALVFSFGGWACAATYIFEPSPSSDLWDLDHYKYYTWGIDWTLPQGETIAAAALSFDNIRNYNSDPNDLYVQLLESANNGVASGTDNQASGNYFENQGIQLYHGIDLSDTSQDIDVIFNTDQISTLLDYLKDGNFGLGFDPDCHFYNDGSILTVNTVHTPIPGAIFLFGSGLIGLVGLRKKLKE